MQVLDKASASAAVKLVIFLVVTTLCTGVLAVVIGNISFGKKTEYRAEFTDVTGVTKGDDVRIAGVRVGSVKKIEVKPGNLAILTFDVQKQTPLTQNTNVAIRFRNLVGQRYLSLSQGADGAKAALKQDSVIPRSQTKEALDLNVLFNGFKPLFQALSPKDTNKLAYELIQVLQGEGGNIKNLLARTSSLTQTLADRDQLIGDVITNLNDVLATVGSRDKELSDTIVTLQKFVTGLKDDRQAILGSIDSVSDLAGTTAGLLQDARDPLTQDIKQLRRASTGLNTPKNKQLIGNALQIFPIKLNRLSNSASTGSYFNFYLCDLKGVIKLPAIPPLTTKETSLVLGDPDKGISVPGAARCEGSS